MYAFCPSFSVSEILYIVLSLMCNFFVRPVALMNKITHFHMQSVVELGSRFSRPPE